MKIQPNISIRKGLKFKKDDADRIVLVDDITDDMVFFRVFSGRFENNKNDSISINEFISNINRNNYKKVI